MLQSEERGLRFSDVVKEESNRGSSKMRIRMAALSQQGPAEWLWYSKNTGGIVVPHADAPSAAPSIVTSHGGTFLAESHRTTSVQSPTARKPTTPCGKYSPAEKSSKASKAASFIVCPQSSVPDLRPFRASPKASTPKPSAFEGSSPHTSRSNYSPWPKPVLWVASSRTDIPSIAKKAGPPKDSLLCDGNSKKETVLCSTERATWIFP